MEAAEEFFDVVDADDRVVGRERRSEVHRRELFHRAVHVFVFNRAGELFLQKRSMSKDTAPGRWVSSCSGHVDSGEAYHAAARRELSEELGLREPSGLEGVLKEPAGRETGWEFVWLYRCNGEGPFELEAGEVDDGQWIRPERLDAWLAGAPRDFALSFVHLWGRYRVVAETARRRH